jgi:hypothetical protein
MRRVALDKIANREILSSFAKLVDGTLLITKELPDQFSSPMVLSLTGGQLRPDQIPNDYLQFAEIKGRVDGRDLSLMCLLINHDLCEIYLRVYFRSIKDFQMQTKSYLVGFKERPKLIESAMRMVMPERYKMSDNMTAAAAELIQIPGLNYVRTNMPQDCKRLLSNDNIAASIADTSEIIMMTIGQFVSGKGCVELALAQKESSPERFQKHLALLETILQSLVQQGIIF